MKKPSRETILEMLRVAFVSGDLSQATFIYLRHRISWQKYQEMHRAHYRRAAK